LKEDGEVGKCEISENAHVHTYSMIDEEHLQAFRQPFQCLKLFLSSGIFPGRVKISPGGNLT
jgi:hypothetical protein